MKRLLSTLFLLLLVVASAKAWSGELDWVFRCADPAHPDYFTDIENLETSGVTAQTVRDALNARLPNQPLGENHACLYDVILRYGDDTTLSLLQARVRDNGRPFRIDDAYLKGLAQDGDVPGCLLNRLKKIKGKTYANAAAYEAALRRLLKRKDFADHGKALLQAGRLDPENYSQDLHYLLRTRDARYPLKDDFIRQLTNLKHSASYEYFLDRHMPDLDVPSKLEVLRHVMRTALRKQPGFSYYAAAKLDEIHKAHPEVYQTFVNTNRGRLPDVFRCVIDDTCP